MQVRELAIEGAWEFTPKLFPDDRGVFLEWFRQPEFTQVTGRELKLAQANMSVSAAGVARGIHFAQLPPSQAKYVMCVRGAFLDTIVDIRVGSPTYGEWTSVLIDDETRRGVFLSEGLGHAIVSLEDDSTVLYLCSEGYAPTREFGVYPLDPDIGIKWPTEDRRGASLPELQLSSKDREAPSLAEANAMNMLPQWLETEAFLQDLIRRTDGNATS